MAAVRTDPPLIVIVGPTASGKTALAIALAKRHGGEIICADSRTVYRGMDIGTAKPTPAEQAAVPHWGLDLVNPGEKFTAADFKCYALEKIAEIRTRGSIPFLVGGTGLYIDAVVFDYQFGGAGDDERRQAMEKMSLDELQSYCVKHNINLPENLQNKRYLIRAIEQKGINEQRRKEPIENTIVVGIATEENVLRTRIVKRSEHLLSNNVVQEAIKLGKKYGWKNEAMTGNIYPLLYSHLAGELSAAEVENKFTTVDWRLAKRQLTWFRRNPHIMWLTLDDAAPYLRHTLAT